ncbi:hypothetical protein [Acinetobacter pollinis]|uniref:Chromosome partition protein Smc n=1 Tax=Acinetobacter pollinis TaxID=2605270 RepID=A0ABU6DUF2_9GAMM|nr:hypothetical protein [Acinetobacter pollinis]MEB5476508.1 hypothetical protein [Acinetobacter pollinis]
MLEELKRLQTHIANFQERLKNLEAENTSLHQQKKEMEKHHDEHTTQQTTTLRSKQDKIDTLTNNLNNLQDQYNALNQDAKTLAERYSRLEKGCTDLKSRFQEILAERNELRVLKEKLHHEQTSAKQEIANLKEERVQLLEKNEHAKLKVEAIIARLAVLGTDEDKNTQEIQKLAHPSEHNEEAQ